METGVLAAQGTVMLRGRAGASTPGSPHRDCLEQLEPRAAGFPETWELK